MKIKINKGDKITQVEIFREYVRGKGLKWTQQRELIASLFLGKRSHLSADQLYARARKKDPKVGYSTVYRTLKLIVDAGLGSERKFGAEEALFEPAVTGEHHDHLICLRCGKIVEFENAKIEDLQKEVASTRDFEIRRHRLILYGYCGKCRRQRVRN